MLTRPDMKQMYGDMHASSKFSGHSLAKHAASIQRQCIDYDARTMLDYGCGRASLYAKLRFQGEKEITPVLYDPYYPPYSKRPAGQFDAVVCTDVMEHVPEEDVHDVLKDIFSFARKFVYLAICTRPARKHLPDGRNCHLTVKSPEWWDEKIKDAKQGRPGLAIIRVYTDD